jgi:hypothetical protein
MIPLIDPVNQLAHFMPNQVLTDVQLNSVVDYLEQQERFTRQRLIGIGVVCGLQANLIVNGNFSTVEISPGVGVTSCGFLINIPDKLVLTKQHNYNTSGYDLFDPYDFLELLPDNTATANAAPLYTRQTTDQVVVLYLDIDDKPNGKCVGENCDDKGNSWVLTVRVLLINKDDADAVLMLVNFLPDTNSFEPYFNPDYMMPKVYIERFGNNNNDPGANFILPSILSFDDFENAYRTIILQASVRVANAIYNAWNLTNDAFLASNVFGTQLQSVNPFADYDKGTAATNALAIQLADLLDQGNSLYKPGNCQYIYDFLRDLTDTYHELRSELFAYFADCCPPYGIFPRHLNLGLLRATVFGQLNPDDYAPPTVYRHFFIPSHTETAQVIYLKKIKQQIQRLQLQIASLDFTGILLGSDKEQIKIIPDKNCAEELGNRSIPFYYEQVNSRLYNFWNYAKLIQNRPFENRSYFANEFAFPASYVSPDIDFAQNPVMADLCKYPKLSIQGHVTKQLSDVLDQLKSMRLQYNLSFDLLALNLSGRTNEVALADENLIADLQAEYLVLRNEYVCCIGDLRNYVNENVSSISSALSIMIFYATGGGGSYPVIQNDVNILLAVYEQALGMLVQSLPPDIISFRFQKLYDIYPIVTTFTSLFKLVIMTWGDLEAFIAGGDPVKILYSKVVTVLLNLWDLYLEKLTDDCIISGFMTLYEMYNERMTSFSFFSEFAKSVPGMEHIAGTSWGGSFILVYDNVRNRKEVSGLIMSEDNKPMSDVEVMSADEQHTVYGKTNNKGLYTVEIPADATAIQFRKQGMITEEKQVKGKKLGTTQIYSHNYFVAKEAWTAPNTTVDPVDELYIKARGVASDLQRVQAESVAHLKKGNDSPVQALADSNLIKTIMKGFVKPIVSFPAIVVNPKNSFFVVADFYLSHPIHNYKLAINHFDACKEKGNLKMIDFAAAAAALSQYMKKSGLQYKMQQLVMKAGS